MVDNQQQQPRKATMAVPSRKVVREAKRSRRQVRELFLMAQKDGMARQDEFVQTINSLPVMARLALAVRVGMGKVRA